MSRLISFSIFLILILSPFLNHAQRFEEEMVHIQNEGHELGGAIMFPEGSKKKLPVVLIIQGSGPTDKDGNSAALEGKNNSLKLLAETLAANGIASLRFDKRGLGLSNHTPTSESELIFEDFVDDARAWLHYLSKDKRFMNIGVIGHSQGSLIGMRISQEPGVKAFASLAGPSLTIDETIMLQIKSNPFNPSNIVEEAKSIFAQLEQGKTVENIPPYLLSVFRPSVQPFMISWMKYDPLVEMEKLEIPILVVAGSTDLQVTVDDAQRLQIANERAELKVIDGMNHILKNAPADKNKNMASYTNPDLPLNEELKETIVAFFEKHLK
ncbi:alpha/beta hydrolase [Roseivirga thermotolerans]|nr:alpha/beta fold hydrolase [Roseivirga thermotolerans]